MPKNEPCKISANGVMLMTVAQGRAAEKTALYTRFPDSAYSWAAVPDPPTQERLFADAAIDMFRPPPPPVQT